MIIYLPPERIPPPAHQEHTKRDEQKRQQESCDPHREVQQRRVGGVELAAQLRRIPHGGHGLGGGLLGRQAPRLQSGGVILQMGGELRRDGLMVRPEADTAAHLGAEIVDGAAAHDPTSPGYKAS